MQNNEPPASEESRSINDLSLQELGEVVQSLTNAIIQISTEYGLEVIAQSADGASGHTSPEANARRAVLVKTWAEHASRLASVALVVQARHPAQSSPPSSLFGLDGKPLNQQPSGLIVP